MEPVTHHLTASDHGSDRKSGGDPPMDDQVAFNNDNPPPDPQMILTENMSATFNSSANPCLDFFFHIVPDTPHNSLVERLNLAWEHDPLTTLKLICNLRGVRGTGKSDKENFYAAALWLHENHPKTLACNLKAFAEFGYFKDLPEILYRLFEGVDIRRERKAAWRSCRKGKGDSRKFYFLAKKSANKKKNDEDPKSAEEKRRLRAMNPREKRIEGNSIKMKEAMEKARELRNSKTLEMAKRASDKYVLDSNFKFLHDQVSTLFSELLKSDIQSLNSSIDDSTKRITLAAKWCPSVDSSYDKALLICKSIAKLIFPRESSQEYANLTDNQYESIVKNRLKKEVLVPLRQALKLPEVYMSAKQWQSVAYDHVASVAMRNYTDIFLHRDNKRFREYLQNVQAGNIKIAAGALLPHEIIKKNSKGSSGEQIVSELQWKRMVNDLLENGKLTNCIAVSDVSGSMYGTPMEVSIALGLLVSELSEDPWKGHVITFSEEPQLHLIKGRSLRSKIEFIEAMNFGYNTNFQKVFDQILEKAVSGNVSEDKMIKKVFVFSDMEFDVASSSSWETDYMAIKRKYKENGYENVPGIVFWNLRDSSATPVKANENGVCLVSGFSKNLLTLFLEKGGEIEEANYVSVGTEEADGQSRKEEENPEATMEAAILGEIYEQLVVYD